MTDDPESTSSNLPKIPDEIIQYMHELYQGQISDQEAHQAARNLIDYCKIVLEIRWTT